MVAARADDALSSEITNPMKSADAKKI